MILTPAIKQLIIDAIQEDPTRPVILPDHCYDSKRRATIEIDYLPYELHRHLYEILIRPLGYHERMFRVPGVPYENINPYLFFVPAPDQRQSGRTHCKKGHSYENNEAPPNPYRCRCAICYRAYIASRIADPAIATPNGKKTHCPKGHAYDSENTRYRKDGRRLCVICVRERNAQYMRNRRLKEKTA